MARRDLASGPIFRIDDIYPNYEEAVMRMVMMVMMMSVMVAVLLMMMIVMVMVMVVMISGHLAKVSVEVSSVRLLQPGAQPKI